MNKEVNTKKTIILSILFILSLRLFSVFFFPITDNTEARYGEISRLIVEYSDWITLHYDENTPFLGKPPLAFWLSAVGIFVFGISDYSPRLPILLAAMGMAVMLFRFVRPQLGTQVAWKTILVLCGSIFFFVSSAVVQPDLILAFCSCWAMIAFWRCANNPKDKSACWQLFAALGFGFMAKALAIGVYAIIPIVIWLTWKKNWLTFLKQAPWISGVMVSLVITIPWMIAVELKNPGFIQYFIIGENFQRFVEAGWSGDQFGRPKSQPFGMILLFCLAGLFPWSLFGIALFWKKQRQNLIDKFRQNKELCTYLLVWSVAPTLTLFFNANYIIPYAIPISIPLSVLIATLFLDFKNKHLIAVSLIIPLALTATIIFALNSATIHRYTQKFLIAAYEEKCSEQDCQLLYIGYNKFSADYYSLKKARKVRNNKKIESFLSPGKVDFIACRENTYFSLPDSIQLKFEKVGSFKPLILLMEN